MALNSESSLRNGSPKKQELPTLQVPPSVALKARSRQRQLHNHLNDKGNNHTENSNSKHTNSNSNSNDEEELEEGFRILQYPPEPWGRASRNRATAIIPSRRIISSLVEDIRPATDSQGSTDTSRNRRNRCVNNIKRVALLKRARCSSTTSVSNATESSDGDSESIFNTRKSSKSSARKRQTKQQRLGQQPFSDTLNVANATTPTTAHLTPRKPKFPRKPLRLRHIETPPDFQDEHVEVLVVDDDEDEDEEEEVVVVDEEDETAAVTNDGDDTSESDYNPGRETMTQHRRQRERKARSRKRGLFRQDEDESQAVEQIQEPKEVHLELDRPTEMPKMEEPYRIIERMDCVVIPVIDLPERSIAARSTRKSAQPPPRTATGKFTRKDIKQEPELKTRVTNTIKDITLTTQSPIKATTPSGTSPDSRRTIEIAPVLDMDLDAPRQTRLDVRKNITANLEPTKTAPPTNAQDLANDRKGSSRQASKDVESPCKPSSTQVRTKIFHGWWLKRKDTLVQEGNLGILVQGNMLEPKPMTWHTSTIKDAPEPTLVMTFTGSFYRLNGSIDVQKMEGNGFSRDVIKAFRNGFPADWKTVLHKAYGTQVTSAVSMGKERPTDKKINTATENDYSALQQQEGSLTQQPRVSVKYGKSIIQHENQQTRQATWEERRIAIEITPEDDSSQMIRETSRRPAVVPVEQASAQVKSASLPSRGPTSAPPRNRAFGRDEAVEITISAASGESFSASSVVSRATKGTTIKKPESRPESLPSNSRKESILTKKPTSAGASTPSASSTPPALTLVKVQEGVTATGQLSTPRRASAPASASLQGDTFILRRLSAPDQSITGMGSWKAVGSTVYGADKSLDRSLDGDLRMRSMAVVERIREHTRQHSDLSTVMTDRAVQEGQLSVNTGSMLTEAELQALGAGSATTLLSLRGSSETTSLPLAKSLTSISSSLRPTFDDSDLTFHDDANLFDKT
ncbi:hypothetical protein BG015_004306 [Linnemannia schmuckeri]|uniref:SANTA domain-containing protein n=1 Tax=Linnemannia schmuckeri TaxID=64567 RepID=A0A9P5RCU2_9FUNG|nr:hypothetical protein BG015_004306 [Linnemannia schmuckeri]